MNKMKERNTDKPLTVDVEALAAMLNCGRVTAAKIGKDAGARIQFGRRVLYKVSVIDAYLEQAAGQQ